MSASWKQRREAGSLVGIRFIRWVATTIGRRAVAVILFPVSLYFVLVRGPERRASKQFLARVLDRKPFFWEPLRHFHTFARVASDRHYFLSRQSDSIPFQVHGNDVITAAEQSECGFVALTSHLGSIDATRMLSFGRKDVSLRVLLDRDISPNFQKVLDSINPELSALIIDASKPSTVLALEIAESVSKGRAVGLPADRYRSGEKTIVCDFLGAPAHYPAGPFAMCVALQVPVVMVTALLLEDGYHIYIDALPVGRPATRQDRQPVLHAAVTGFARRLETYARIAPFNWFNFYDFWQVRENSD